VPIWFIKNLDTNEALEYAATSISLVLEELGWHQGNVLFNMTGMKAAPGFYYWIHRVNSQENL
jgi:hypothetical protein